jgi:hypothetical protein
MDRLLPADIYITGFIQAAFMDTVYLWLDKRNGDSPVDYCRGLSCYLLRGYSSQWALFCRFTTILRPAACNHTGTLAGEATVL